MASFLYTYMEGDGKTLYPILEKNVPGFKEKVKDYATFAQIVSADPTSKVDGEDVKFVGNYSKWLVRQFIAGNFKLEDAYKATDYLTAFRRHYQKLEDVKLRDINNYKTLAQLYEVLEKNGLLERQTKGELRQKVHEAVKDIKLVYESPKWKIVIPLTYEASCNWGAETEWCTATRSNDSWFKNYTKDGPLYILINQEDPKEKYQFHFPTNQYMDRRDRPINVGAFFKKYPELSKPFFPILSENIEKNPETGVEVIVTHDQVTITVDSIKQFGDKFQSSGREQNYIPSRWIHDFLEGLEPFTYIDYEPDLSTEKWIWKNTSKENISEIRNLLKYHEGTVQELFAKIQETNSKLAKKIQKAAVKGAEAGAAENCKTEIIKAIKHSGFEQMTDGKWKAVVKNVGPLFYLSNGNWSGLFRSSGDEKPIFNLYLLNPEQEFAGFDPQIYNSLLSETIKPKTIAEPKEEPKLKRTKKVPEPVEAAKRVRKTKKEVPMEEDNVPLNLLDTYLAKVAETIRHD